MLPSIQVQELPITQGLPRNVLMSVSLIQNKYNVRIKIDIHLGAGLLYSSAIMIR